MYELLALDLDSIKPPDEDEGGTEGGGSPSRPSRHRLDLVQAAPTRVSVPVSSSPVSREASCYSVALDIWLHTRYQVSEMVRYQVPGT